MATGVHVMEGEGGKDGRINKEVTRYSKRNLRQEFEEERSFFTAREGEGGRETTFSQRQEGSP